MQPQTSQSVTTTFLLLRPITPDRPPVTNTELRAGHGFNLALRAMASRDGFKTQWFGWQHPTSVLQESKECPERLFWVIDWQDSVSAQALTFAGELENTMGDLARFFELPKSVPPTHCIAAEVGASSILVVDWSQGDAQKLLTWTNRDLMLEVRKKFSHESAASVKQTEAVTEDEWVACGQVIAPNTWDEDWTSATVLLRSFQPQERAQDLPAEKHADTEVHDCSRASVTVSLTRTRWCTKIRRDLMETIKARRVD